MTRNAYLLELILQKARRPLSRTRLLKIAYMADLWAWRVLGKPISEFRYRRHKNGPFDSQLYHAVEELSEADRAEITEKTTQKGYDCTLVEATTRQTPEGFSPAEIFLIELAVSRYGKMDLSKLLSEVVYDTEPMKVDRGAPLPMESERNKESEKYGGISLERVLQSRQEIKEGRIVSLESLREEIAQGLAAE